METLVPDLHDISKGVLYCPKCGEKLEWNKQLTVDDCVSCGVSLYYPMFLRDYIIYKPIAGGGIGHVFKAMKPGSEERYAIKILHRSYKEDPRFKCDIMREAHAGSIIGVHPNLISVIEYGYENGEYYIVTPFIVGERLDEYVTRKSHLSERRALNITLQIIEAENHILQHGFLYRDLKPENIILEEDGNVRIFDYGLCITQEEAISQDEPPDDFDGSPFYVPPERVVGASEGEHSEIYSLGMIMFYMLKGRPYFTETEINDLVVKHVSSFRILSVCGALKNCNQDLAKIIDKMIARKPKMRYHNFKSLKSDLLAIFLKTLEKPSIQLNLAMKKKS